MKKLFGLVLLLVAGAMVLDACKDDITLPDPPSLVGDYVGTYTRSTRVGVDVFDTVQAVTFRFDSTGYNMKADIESDLFNPNVCFCKANGVWGITDRLRLDPDDPEAVLVDNCSTCDPAQSPQGLYSLEQPGGNIRLIQIETIDNKQITSLLELTRIVIADSTK